jgi:hypothetical protein
LSNGFAIPERCLLVQAALYVDVGRIPIPDEIYLSAPDRVADGPNSLTRALRAKSLCAWGSLVEAFRRTDNWILASDWEPFSSWPLIEEVEIDPELWSHEQIIFSRSQLAAESAAISRIYRVPPLDREALLHLPFLNETENFENALDMETAFLFSRITVQTADLFRVFPRPAASGLTIETASKVGRPPKYRWDDFFAEIIVRTDLDGLPETQAELIAQMATWCIENWGDQPAESVLKERTAEIFRHRRKSRS